MKYRKNLLFIFVFFCLLSWSARIVEPKAYTIESGVESRDIHAINVLSEPPQTLQVLFLGDSEIQTGVLPMELWNTMELPLMSAGSRGRERWSLIFG